jgi:thiol-disulfide isomerase/thioredoxin
MKTVRLVACLLMLGLGALFLTGALVTRCQAQGGVPTIVEFRSPICPFCYQQSEILSELEKKYPGQFLVQYYSNNTDQPMFNKYNVSLVPTLLILSPSGSEIYRHEGLLPKDQLVSTLKSMNYLHD